MAHLLLVAHSAFPAPNAFLDAFPAFVDYCRGSVSQPGILLWCSSETQASQSLCLPTTDEIRKHLSMETTAQSDLDSALDRDLRDWTWLLSDSSE
jgi:hypothetical protein